MRQRTDRPLATAKDVAGWLAGSGRSVLPSCRAELPAAWLLPGLRIRRRIRREIAERWNGDPRFRLDVEQSLRTLPECLLEIARRLAANQLLALSTEDSVRRIVAVPRVVASVAFAHRIHRELAPLHDLAKYPGLLEAVLRRLATAREEEGFRKLRRTGAAIPSVPRALVLGGERRLRWGTAPGPRGTWWVLETRLSSNDFTRDDARAAIARSLRPTLRALKKDLRRRKPESRRSIGDRAVSIAIERAAPGLPPGPRPRRRPQAGVVVVTSGDLDASQGRYVGAPGPTGIPSANTQT